MLTRATKKHQQTADDRLQVVLNRLDDHAGELTYDSETSGLDWRKQHVVGHVVTFSPDPRDSYYVPFRHAGGGNVGGHVGPQSPEAWDEKLAPGEKELLGKVFSKGRKIIGHNLAFDLKFVYRLIGGHAFEPQFEDTMINEPLLDEFGRFSLEACCIKRKVQTKKGDALYQRIASLFPGVKPDRSSMAHYWRLAGDDPVGVEYAIGDGTSTWQLRDAQRVEIVAQGLERVHDVESRLIRVLARMTCRGIRVDEQYFHDLRDRLDEQIGRMMEIFPDPANASVQASKDVQWYMEKMGVTDWPLTPKTQKPSFPEKWLMQSEPGRKIVEIRHIVHMRNSFVNPLIEEHIWKGRVHANFNQLRNDDFGTVTGRLSCDSPNLQQAHKRDATRGRMLRGGFIPDPGMVFGEVDYSQCEPRLLGYYSRCRVLLEGYRATPSVDAHTAVAMAINRNQWDAADDKQRKAWRETGKRVNQTLVTGGGKGVIVERYGVDPREVDRIWNDYFRAMPEIKVLQKKAARRMEDRGYVVSLLGRRARLKDRDRSYIAVNRLLQCGNADILKSKMVELDDYLESEGRPPVEVLNNIHDAFDFQFDPAHRKVYNECLDIMTRFGPNDPIPLDVPMEIDAGEGPNWAVATFGEESK